MIDTRESHDNKSCIPKNSLGTETPVEGEQLQKHKFIAGACLDLLFVKLINFDILENNMHPESTLIDCDGAQLFPWQTSVWNTF